jgi:hypothetical protein
VTATAHFVHDGRHWYRHGVNLSLGGGKRTMVVASTMLALTGLSACSDGSSPLDEPTPSSSKTPDQTAKDEAAVTKLAQRYWDAVVEAENTGNDDAAQFEGIADPKVAEIELGQVGRYQDLDLLRVGKPAITEIEALVTGDSAEIRLCKDEDDWTAEVDGTPVPDDKKFGNGPWGARADRVDGEWLIVEIRQPDKGTKKCA